MRAGRDGDEGGSRPLRTGRALVIEAVPRGDDVRLRCAGRTGIPADELFARTGGGRAFTSPVEETGRAEAVRSAFGGRLRPKES